MKKLTLSALSLTIILSNGFSALAFEAPKLTPSDIENLNNGEAIISVWKDKMRDHKPTVTKGGIDIMVPAADVLDLVKDCARISDVSPDIRDCEVLEISADGSWDIRKQKLAVSPVLPKIKTTFRTRYTRGPGVGYVLQIENISGDLKVQEARWDIISLGPENTRVIYQAAFKPSLPIPAKVIRKQVAIGIPDILENLREIAETDYASNVLIAAMPKRDDM